MPEVNDWNRRIIAEFRENAGKVGGPFEGRPMLLLHHIGARTGVERVNPLVYQPVGEAMAIFGSKGGGPKHPDWFHNVVANPHAEVEVGTETIAVTARVATGEERDRIWTKQKEIAPAFADYETKTTREIPVGILGAHGPFPKIDIYPGYGCTEAVGLTDGNQVNLVVVYLEGRHACHRVPHGFLDLRQWIFLPQVEGRDARHDFPPCQGLTWSGCPEPRISSAT